MVVGDNSGFRCGGMLGDLLELCRLTGAADDAQLRDYDARWSAALRRCDTACGGAYSLPRCGAVEA